MSLVRHMPTGMRGCAVATPAQLAGHRHMFAAQHHRVAPRRRQPVRQLHPLLARPTVVVCASSGQFPSSADDRSTQRNLWAAVDVAGWLGSVAGAAAFVLTQEMWLVGLPVVLPLVALYASRRVESLAAQVRDGCAMHACLLACVL